MSHTQFAAAPKQASLFAIEPPGHLADAPQALLDHLAAVREMPPPNAFVLDEAKKIVYGPRQDQYGHPAVNFQRIAEAWGAVFGRPVSRGEVGLAMIQLKVMRAVNQLKAEASQDEIRDTFVDIAGYSEATMRAMFEKAP